MAPLGRRAISSLFLVLVASCGGSAADTHEARRQFLIAAEDGAVEHVKDALANGVAPDDTFNQNDRTALHLAALNGRVDVVKVLLAAGADPNQTWKGETIQADLRGFRKSLAAVKKDPDQHGTYLKQDGTTVDFASLPLREQEWDEILKLLDDAAARAKK